jgi:hypothetical protein
MRTFGFDSRAVRWASAIWFGHFASRNIAMPDGVYNQL